MRYFARIVWKILMSEPVQEPALLDATGLSCPMPLLKAKQMLNNLTGGALLRIIATDPGSVRDFEVFARQSGHVLIESKSCNGRFEYLLRKKA
jgi:tRNA 2-thiouridine synthesizing protein A